MIELGISAKRLGFAGVTLLSAVGLSGCFDLEQRIGLHRDGSGTYAVVVTAEGVVGEGLAKDKGRDSDIDLGDERAVKHVTRKGDKTVQTSEIAFKDVSELKLDDETIALHVKGKKDNGESEVNFHRSFRVDHAREHNDKDDEAMGREVLQSMFGGHTYKFAVWLPGTIEHVAPIKVAGHVVRPMIWNDRYGHTLIWQMALPDMFMANQLDFDVDFSAKGEFRDSQSRPGEPHHKHRHHHDDDDDNDD